MLMNKRQELASAAVGVSTKSNMVKENDFYIISYWLYHLFVWVVNT